MLGVQSHTDETVDCLSSIRATHSQGDLIQQVGMWTTGPCLLRAKDRMLVKSGTPEGVKPLNLRLGSIFICSAVNGELKLQSP